MKKLNLKTLCSTMLSRGGQNFRNIENGFERIQEEYICNFNKPKKKGFTLAETLITLTILGVVAAITIPMLINRQQEAANRTKVKKAMEVYEKALNNMIIENDLKSNNAIITFGAEGGACANTTAYFKKVEGDGCRFKTADRIWWDITDIENPLIILNDKMKDKEVAELKTLAKDTNDITTYAMIGRLDETTNAGIVRINDNAFEQANGTADQKAYMSKLYGFINPAKVASGEAKKKTYISSCTKNVDNTTYTCEGSNAKFYSATFTEACVTLPNGQESCPTSTKPTVVAMIQKNNWNDAGKTCPEGTHLINAAEVKQLYNNGASGNTLESLCSSCKLKNYAWFWVAEEPSANSMGSYAFYYDKTFMSVIKTGSNGHVVCVGD